MSRFSLCALVRRLGQLRRRMGLLTRQERDWLARLDAAVAGLPEPTGSVFRAVRNRQLSYTEVAAELGLSVQDVEAHIARALRILAAVPGAGQSQ